MLGTWSISGEELIRLKTGDRENAKKQVEPEEEAKKVEIIEDERSTSGLQKMGTSQAENMSLKAETIKSAQKEQKVTQEPAKPEEAVPEPAKKVEDHQPQSKPEPVPEPVPAPAEPDKVPAEEDKKAPAASVAAVPEPAQKVEEEKVVEIPKQDLAKTEPAVEKRPAASRTVILADKKDVDPDARKAFQQAILAKVAALGIDKDKTSGGVYVQEAAKRIENILNDNSIFWEVFKKHAKNV